MSNDRLTSDTPGVRMDRRGFLRTAFNLGAGLGAAALVVGCDKPKTGGVGETEAKNEPAEPKIEIDPQFTSPDGRESAWNNTGIDSDSTKVIHTGTEGIIYLDPYNLEYYRGLTISMLAGAIARNPKAVAVSMKQQGFVFVEESTDKPTTGSVNKWMVVQGDLEAGATPEDVWESLQTKQQNLISVYTVQDQETAEARSTGISFRNDGLGVIDRQNGKFVGFTPDNKANIKRVKAIAKETVMAEHRWANKA